jgi:hypothetical protein
MVEVPPTIIGAGVYYYRMRLRRASGTAARGVGVQGGDRDAAWITGGFRIAGFGAGIHVVLHMVIPHTPARWKMDGSILS